mmetsp:Transcript_28633/g.96406  ORF Transcript_28633/g.96406 Transcript_28633/m.96406 type:complete len:219 (-) Transcript_28633:2116-2772(-)
MAFNCGVGLASSGRLKNSTRVPSQSRNKAFLPGADAENRAATSANGRGGTTSAARESRGRCVSSATKARTHSASPRASASICATTSAKHSPRRASPSTATRRMPARTPVQSFAAAKTCCPFCMRCIAASPRAMLTSMRPVSVVRRERAQNTASFAASASRIGVVRSQRSLGSSSSAVKMARATASVLCGFTTSASNISCAAPQVSERTTAPGSTPSTV